MDLDKPDQRRVGIVMGSDSDWPTMQAAAEALQEFGVGYEADVVSAHRMPEEMIDYGKQAHERGLAVIIAGADHLVQCSVLYDTTRGATQAERVKTNCYELR